MLLPSSCKRKRGKALGAILWLEPKEHTFHSASAATENGTVLDLGGKYGSLAVQVVGSTWTGTITFKVSVDGTNYVAIEGVNINDGSKASTATSSGIFLFNVSGVTKFMADHTRTAGSVTVKGVAQAIPPGNLADVQLTASSVTVTQATHDNLNLNANMQVANVDVGNANPVPVSDAGTTLSVDDGAGSLTVDSAQLPAALTASGNLKAALVESTATVTVGDGGSTLSIDDGAGSITVDGTVTVQDGGGSLTVDGTVGVSSLPSIPAGANIIGVVGIDQTAPGTTNGVQVVAALPAGTNNIGDVDIASASFEGTPGAAVPGKAVQIGASDGTNLQTLKVDAQSNLLVGIRSSVGARVQAYTPSFDAGGTSGVDHAIFAVGFNYDFNNTDWDRHRNNTEGTLLASAARTTTAESAVQTLYNHNGVTANVDVTAKVGATTITINLLIKDANGDYQVFASSAALAAAAGTTYSVTFKPGVVNADFATNHSGKSVPVPRSYKIQFVPSDADSVTYSASQAQEL